ncbi:IclR family transcriptional regulator [Microbacterium halophytorum]|uniref:IclR family transcriptional regulator n=1 Tax=Microbacterium halophytorum TaxID=2067568 RepID=UPI000CFB1B41|nr:helix-turn-helix domain-containing protein [Microbacterium halophytorum]
MRTAEWTQSVSVLDRLTAVLDAFGHDGKGLTVTELARRANLPKSTVSRIASELVDEGYLDRDGTLLYLGVRLFEFGQSVDGPRRLREVSRPAIKRLRDATGCDVHVAVVDGDGVIIVAEARSRSGTAAVDVGDRLSRSDTALGLAYAAAADSAATGDAPTTRECSHRDLRCVAAAIIARNRPAAALAVSGAASEVRAADVAPLVQATAITIGRALSDG